MRTKFIAPLSVVCTLSVFGCAETLPKELADARTAYERASHGPAAQLSPADLHTAQTSLNDAERSFEEDGNSQVTRDLAYMAERRAQLAEVHARTAAANNTADRLAQQHDKSRDAQLASAQSELAQEQARRADAEKRARQAMNDLAAVAAVKQDSRGTVITLSGSVLFESGKSELKSPAEARLGQVATALTESDPNSQIVVQGYTDSQGSLKTNEKLSKERAESVRAFLVTRGVASDRIRAEGFGPANPVADNKSPEGRANNRRVEIVVSPSSGTTSPTQVP